MIFQPKIGQWVEVNYKDKTMPHQMAAGQIKAVGNGKGPRNVLVELRWLMNRTYVIIPRGNLVAI